MFSIISYVGNRPNITDYVLYTELGRSQTITKHSFSNLTFLLAPLKKTRILAQPNFGIKAGWRTGVNQIHSILQLPFLPFVRECEYSFGLI